MFECGDVRARARVDCAAGHCSVGMPPDSQKQRQDRSYLSFFDDESIAFQVNINEQELQQPAC